MEALLFVCMPGAGVAITTHFLPVEHLKLEEKHGRDKGRKIGKICSLV